MLTLMDIHIFDINLYGHGINLHRHDINPYGPTI